MACIYYLCNILVYLHFVKWLKQENKDNHHLIYLTFCDKKQLVITILAIFQYTLLTIVNSYSLLFHLPV